MCVVCCVCVILRYVKRELRTLTEADREKFLDAAQALWQYNDVDGQKKYGDYFTSVQTYVIEHAQASGDIQCDQFHEGTGNQLPFILCMDCCGCLCELWALWYGTSPQYLSSIWTFIIEDDTLSSTWCREQCVGFRAYRLTKLRCFLCIMVVGHVGYV
jgi:hypothetical protein